MSSLSQWIIVILVQIVFDSSGVFSGGDGGEHVHIKVHIPEVRRKHTHFHKVQKHIFHPKKVVKTPEYLDADLDVMHKPLSTMSYGHSMQFPSLPIGIGTLPDIPTYGLDNTLEATIMKKPKINSMSHMISEDMFSKFHGMKKSSEFLGARPVAQMQTFTSPDAEGENYEDAFSDEYDTHSTESIIMDQRVAGGSLYPNSMTMESPFKPKWQAAAYSNIYESSAKPYMKWPSWLSSTTDDDLETYERFPSSTTMYISKARPISGSRPKFGQDSFETNPYSETWVMPKRKKSKSEKRKRTTHSPAFRINYKNL